MGSYSDTYQKVFSLHQISDYTTCNLVILLN